MTSGKTLYGFKNRSCSLVKMTLTGPGPRLRALPAEHACHRQGFLAKHARDLSSHASHHSIRYRACTRMSTKYEYHSTEIVPGTHMILACFSTIKPGLNPAGGPTQDKGLARQKSLQSEPSQERAPKAPAATSAKPLAHRSLSCGQARVQHCRPSQVLWLHTRHNRGAGAAAHVRAVLNPGDECSRGARWHAPST